VIIIGAEARRPTLLDDEDVDVSIETPAFLKKIVREEGTGGPSANNRNAVAVPEVY